MSEPILDGAKEAELKRRTDALLAQTISWMLIVGVSLSAIVLAFGLALVAVTGQTGYDSAVQTQLLFIGEGQARYPRTIPDVVSGALALRPFAVIELGALLLIATPVFRVAASALLFLYERDRLYTLVTLVVLVLLLFSIFFVR